MRDQQELSKISDEITEKVLSWMSNGPLKTLDPSEYLFVQVILATRLLFATITLSHSILGDKTAREMFESIIESTLQFLNQKRSSTDEKTSDSITSFNRH